MWKDEFELIDFHSHILPEVDDGSESVDMSVAMLEMLMKQGVDKVVSTSHYYNFKESLESFLKRRDEAMVKLERHIKEHDLFLPEIIYGAEVRLYPGLWQEENLGGLCVGNSKNILIEMPYDFWTPWMFNEIYSVASKGYTPIMAHVERYVDFVSPKDITEKLIPLDVLVQCNADFVEDRRRRKFVKKLVKTNSFHVLGSDCHNLTTRKACINDACEYISKKFGDETLKEIMLNATECISSI